MKHYLLVFGLAFGLAGCAARTPTVTIFAAVSTKEALERAAHDFETETGTRVTCSFAASSMMARQIEQGGAADVFLSADEHWADHLAGKGFVGARRDLLANRLVVVTPADQPLKIPHLSDLAGEKVKRLALALEPVPAGRYAREALKKAGIWEQVKERVHEVGDVRATLMLVTRGEVDAGLVYATDAATTDKVRVALVVPENLHTPIRYPLVLLQRPGLSPHARAFYDFLGGESAQAHFRKAGFQLATDERR